MNCDECSEMLTSLAFGEISEDQELNLHEHLAGCDSCREAYIEAVETKAKLEEALCSEAPEAGLSDTHKQKIMSSVTQKDSVKSPKVFPTWVFALAACIIIGIFVGVKLKTDRPYSLAKSEEAVVNDAVREEGALKEAEAPGLPKKVKQASNFKSRALKDKNLADADKSVEAEEGLEKLVVAKKKEAKRQSVGRSKKIQPAAELQAMKADTLSLAENKNILTIDNLRQMFLKYEKHSNLPIDQKSILAELKELNNDQIHLVNMGVDKGAKKGSEKFLVRISINGEKAIDYAHIFVHNQNIIQVERVR